MLNWIKELFNRPTPAQARPPVISSSPLPIWGKFTIENMRFQFAGKRICKDIENKLILNVDYDVNMDGMEFGISIENEELIRKKHPEKFIYKKAQNYIDI